MKALYFDCFSGISGDMTLGALVDLGVSEKTIIQGLRKLPVRGYHFHVEKAQRGGITGTKAIVAVKKDSREERSYSRISRMILDSALPDGVKTMSLEIFKELATAESKVHGVHVGRVHFHEVGSVDSIIDIVGTCLGIDSLKVQTIRSSPLPWGSGWVESHGTVLPLPAPATAELFKGVPVVPQRASPSVSGPEYVTPTGMAILRGVADEFGGMPPMTLDNVGYGVGTGDYDVPNLLRVVMGNLEEEEEGVILMETNIDDMSPQLYDSLTDKLFQEGALDVFLTPVQMKKGRPGVLVTAIIREEDRDRIAETIFSESTSIGLRWIRMNRYVLEREQVSMKLPGGTIRGKYSRGPGDRMVTPEYDDVRRLARTTGRPVKDVYYEALSSCGIFPSSRSSEKSAETRETRRSTKHNGFPHHQGPPGAIRRNPDRRRMKGKP